MRQLSLAVYIGSLEVIRLTLAIMFAGAQT
jgi:hypothetical protein